MASAPAGTGPGVASGEASKSEALGHREYYVMYKYQDAPARTAGCRE